MNAVEIEGALCTRSLIESEITGLMKIGALMVDDREFNRPRILDYTSKIVRQVAVKVTSIGICPSDGGRVEQVAAIELLNGQKSGKCWHAILNPEVDLERFHWDGKADALNRPRFKEVAVDFIEFLSDSELIFSTAVIQIEFLNAELTLMGLPQLTNPILDLSELAKPLHPAASCSHGYLVKRYRISISEQKYHGLLRETKELVEAFRAIEQRRQQNCHQGREYHSGLPSGILDLTEAKMIIEDVPPSYDSGNLDLSAYHGATPDALGFLSTQGYDGFVHMGLVELDRLTAQILSQWSVFFIFSNIRKLKSEVVAEFSEETQLAFEGDGLIEFGPDLAREFAKMKSCIALHLAGLSLESVFELAKQSAEMYLELDAPPSDEVLRALCFHDGYRVHICWKRPTGVAPLEFKSVSEQKKIFVLPHYFERANQWFENVYIGDSDSYPDSLIDENGITCLL